MEYPLIGLGIEYPEVAFRYPDIPWRFWSLDTDALAGLREWVGGGLCSITQDRTSEDQRITVQQLLPTEEYLDIAYKGQLRSTLIRALWFWKEADNTWAPTGELFEGRLSGGEIVDGRAYVAQALALPVERKVSEENWNHSNHYNRHPGDLFFREAARWASQPRVYNINYSIETE